MELVVPGHGVWLMWLLGYHACVATAVGFIALAGVAPETGVVVLIYLDQAWRARTEAGDASPLGLHSAILEGAVARVELMIVTAIIVASARGAPVA